MRHQIKYLPWLALIALSCFGCRELDLNGIYKGDKVLYNADKTIGDAYDIMHGFVTWEYQNRVALSKWPEIKVAADNVRKNAQTWIASAVALREAYATAKTPDNASKLQAALTTLQAAMLQAQTYLAKPLTVPATTPH